MNQKYTYKQVRDSSVEYFEGDELAGEVFPGKYALQNLEGEYFELTPSDMHRRLAREFARIESRYPNPMLEDEIFDMFKTWSVVPQGSPMSGIGNPFQVQSISNCFVIDPPEDSYGGILRADQEQAQIMKRRGGVGHDISKIRPKGLVAANAARTTDGIAVFMDRFSNTTREVAQNGRRGALMISISVHHPEIETFINIKKDKKRVTGANISVRISDEFMIAVKSDSEYEQRWPVDSSSPSIIKKEKARKIWDMMMQAAWESAEPGVLFWDNIINNSPADCYASLGYKTSSTNPCIVGKTLIATADGRNAVTIEQLCKEGKDIPVYSTNVETGRVEIKMGRNPRMTKTGADVWKLTLDDGSFLMATPDHRIMLRDRTYIQLKDLKPGMSIFPFNSFNSNGYRQVCQTGAEIGTNLRRNRRQYRLIHEFFNGETDSKTFAIHHKDCNSENDSIENLQVMSHEEHIELHSKNMMGDKNPYHKMSEQWKSNFATHKGDKNGRYLGHSNEELLNHGRKVFIENGSISKRMWQKYAAENNLPRFVGTDCRFGSWNNFKNQVSSNHKVSSVEFFGHEDVYNITVDDNHNYHVITSLEENAVISSGICVKNCGELPLSPYDSCRLLLMNLMKFVQNAYTEDAEFDLERFYEYSKKAQRLIDDMIDLELEMVDKIISKINSDSEPDHVKRTELELWTKIRLATSNARRTGLGITALGDVLAALGVKYGSDESIAITEEIYKNLALASYESSIIMAKERGAFPIWNLELEKNHTFINQVIDAFPDSKRDLLKAMWIKYGRRNIANLTTSPAGTVSVETQTTSGGEPAFLVGYKRRKKINNSDKLARVDFVDESGDRWQEYMVFHHGHQKWAKINGKDPELDMKQSPYYGSTSADIDWIRKIKLQAAAQKWVDHAISNTTNIPKDTSVETVSEIYMTGWESGCKGVTIYRDGSRSGVLISSNETSNKNTRESSAIPESHAPKRPEVLSCDIHNATVKGQKYLVLIGLLDGKPYEIFCGLADKINTKLPKKGTIQKVPQKNGVARYDLHTYHEDGTEDVYADIVDGFDNENYGAFTRILSTSLRHGVPVQFVVEQLVKDKHSDMWSFSTVIARILSKNYISDGTKTSVKACPECKSTNLSYQQGCVACLDCGNSKCS